MREFVITAKSPLVVRRSDALDSDRICQLLPGRRIYLLELKQDANCTRALAAVDQDEEDEEEAALAFSWKATYGARPFWVDDQIADAQLTRARSPRSPRSPRKVPIGWVTISKDGRQLITPHCVLAAGDRQLHMQAWARRLAASTAPPPLEAARRRRRPCRGAHAPR